MGLSYLSYGNQEINIEADTLRMVCAIIVKEFDALPPLSPERAVISRLRDDFVQAQFYGYSVVVDIKRIYPEKCELGPLILFLTKLELKVSQLGEVMPKTYVVSLPGGAGKERDCWSVAEIATKLGELRELLLKASLAGSNPDSAL